MSEYSKYLPSLETHYHESVQVRVSEVPGSLITDAWVNPLALDSLQGPAKQYACEDYFIQSARLSVPRTFAAESRYVPLSHGRVLPVGYDVIPYESMIGTVIQSKGNWFSGAKYAKYEYLYPHVDKFCGIETQWDADGDIEVSNALIPHEFRAALILGYVVLDERKMEQWLCDNWLSADFSTNNLVEQIFHNIREADYGPPVIAFRVGGTLPRIINNLYPDEQQIRTFQQHLRHGAITHLLELEHGSEGIKRAIQLSGQPMEKVRDTLISIVESNPLPMSHIDRHNEFLCAIIALNAYAVYQATQYTTNLSFEASDIGSAKDTDTALVWYDGDNAWREPDEQANPLDNGGTYLLKAIKTLEEYWILLKKAQVTSDFNLDHIAPAAIRMYQDLVGVR